MTDVRTCLICPPPLSGNQPVDANHACSCKAASRNERNSAFLRDWRAFADALPSTAVQAQALLPGFTIDDPLAFVDGYKKGIRDKCDEIEFADYLLLNWSGSVGSPIGYGEGVHSGANDCLKAFNQLIMPPAQAA